MWAEGPSNASFAARFLSRIPEFTGRPSTQGVNPPSGLLPYDDFNGLPGTYAHLETLFLDHNFDYPVIKERFDLIVGGYVNAIADELTAQGFDCDGTFLPDPPSADELKRLRNLGFQNFQKYGADPISFSTGNYTNIEEIFELPGVGAQVMDFALSYNAQDPRPSRFGVGWQFEYGANTQLYDDDSVLVTLGDGRSLYYEPNGAGGYIEPDGANAALVRSGSTLTFTMADTTRYVFEENEDTGIGVLVSQTDRQGNAFTLAYGAANDLGVLPLVSVTDEAGQTVTFASDEFARITQITHPDGRVWSFSYDEVGDLTVITDPSGLTRRFGYEEHRIVTVTGRDGIVYLTNTYDDQARVVRQVDARGSVRNITYRDGETVYSDNEGNETTYRFNELGQVTEIIDAVGNDLLNAFDDDYNTTGESDARGNDWAFEFDTEGNQTATTDPLGNRFESAYNANSDLTSTTEIGADGATRTTSFTVNARGLVTAVANPDGTTTSTTYNSNGDPTATTDENGHTTTFGYDSRGNLVKIIDAAGGETMLAYDLANRLVSSTNARGATTTFAYDTSDNLISITDSLGGVTGFEFGPNNELVAQTDANGNTTSYGYDGNLNLVEVTNPDGTKQSFDYDLEDNVVAETNENGATTSYDLDPLYRIGTRTDAEGHDWTTSYDENGNVTSVTDPLGNVTSYTYDALNRIVTMTDATGAVTTYSYDSFGRAIAITDGNGHIRRFEYDIRDRLTAEIDAAGDRTEFSYDSVGNQVSMTDPTGQVTTMSYDELHRLVETVDPLGGIARISYDPVGNIVTNTDENGHTTSFEHDLLDRLTTVTDAAGFETINTYDPVGNLLTVTDARGGTISFGYDTRNRRISETDQNGFTTTYDMDGVGNQISMTAPDGIVSGYEFDGRNLLTAVVENVTGGPATVDANVRTVYGYDAAGRRATITDANGNTTTFGFDPVGRVASETNPNDNVWSYFYDPVGNLTRKTTPTWQTIDFAYTDDDLLQRVTPSGEAEITYDYDANGNRTSMTDGIGASTWVFDALDRLTEETDSLGQVISYTYDPVGNVTSLTSPSGDTTVYTFDERDLMASLASPWQNTTYSYDEVGNLLTETKSNGTVTTRTYDPASRLLDLIHTGRAPQVAAPAPDDPSAGNGKAKGARDNFPDEGTDGNCGKGQGNGNAPCSGDDTGTGSDELVTILGYSYTFDSVGNVIARDDHVIGGVNHNAYDYDPLRRLVHSVSDVYGTTAYTFDSVGNRQSLTATDDPDTAKPNDPLAVTYQYNAANELTDYESTTGTGKSAKTTTTVNEFDAAGRLIQSTETSQGPAEVTNRTYNWRDQPLAISRGKKATEQIRDGIGRTLQRVEQTGNSTKTTDVTYQGLDPIQHTDDQGHEEVFVRGALGLIDHAGNNQTATVYTYHHDGLSNVGGLSRESGRLEDTQTYTDFGSPSGPGGFSSVFGWNEQPRNRTFGVSEYYARDLDSEVGRWSSADAMRGEVQYPRTQHRRAYVANSPISFSDLLGFERVASLRSPRILVAGVQGVRDRGAAATVPSCSSYVLQGSGACVLQGAIQYPSRGYVPWGAGVAYDPINVIVNRLKSIETFDHLYDRWYDRYDKKLSQLVAYTRTGGYLDTKLEVYNQYGAYAPISLATEAYYDIFGNIAFGILAARLGIGQTVAQSGAIVFGGGIDSSDALSIYIGYQINRSIGGDFSKLTRSLVVRHILAARAAYDRTSRPARLRSRGLQGDFEPRWFA